MRVWSDDGTRAQRALEHGSQGGVRAAGTISLREIAKPERVSVLVSKFFRHL